MGKKGIWIGIVILLVVLFAAAYFIFWNTNKISDIKNPEHVGKTVKVSGEVKTVIKIGQLSGFSLEDETGTIAVSSQELPKEGEKRIVSGILMKDSLFGYYIKT